jgi:hypothetical protein
VLNCREVTRLASAKQERSLTLTEAMGFHFHTFMCKGCRNFDTQMGDLRKLMKAFAAGVDEASDKTERSGKDQDK